jgi:hypothetical protein
MQPSTPKDLLHGLISVILRGGGGGGGGVNTSAPEDLPHEAQDQNQTAHQQNDVQLLHLLKTSNGVLHKHVGGGGEAVIHVSSTHR